MIKKRNGIGFILITVIFVLSACGSTSNSTHRKEALPTDGPSSTGSASNAESIYKSNCLSCHGGNLQGKIGPSLDKVGSKLTKEQIAAKIQNGGGGMPTYKSKLKEADLEILSEWLSTKK
ncbi:cytochrome c [Paenibacillus sp. SYP-B3998]|uniref:Cytochrome c n=1 Tax=Paenibacillus sp. SYP-B3998 TaxID=2678564 RepID=A0A6G3ZVQ9_9BACL|nr:cytochrome c [Paenibacillus sp. SYP-B3998]NEW05679.1 cytochrome c [Paenibacillus sp. SYP-B3998]